MLGRLAADSVERNSANGYIFTSFPLATNDKDGTIYIDCTAFGQNSKLIMQTLKKGAQILVFGTLHKLGTYKAKDDIIKLQMNVTVDRFEYVSPKEK